MHSVRRALFTQARHSPRSHGSDSYYNATFGWRRCPADANVIRTLSRLVDAKRLAHPATILLRHPLESRLDRSRCSCGIEKRAVASRAGEVGAILRQCIAVARQFDGAPNI